MFPEPEYELFSLIPPIKRARGYYLYDYRGRRYIDMFLNNGRALFGHRPSGVAGELKNTLAKGILANYPSIYPKRLEKALRPLFPGHPVFRVYRSPEKAAATAAAALGTTELSIADPAAIPDKASGETPDVAADKTASKPIRAALWRPFLEEAAVSVSVPVLFPVIPFPGDFGPVIVCFKKEFEDHLPPSDPVSPVLLASLVRCIYTGITCRETMDSHNWPRCDSVYFRQKGPYVHPRCGREEYKSLFRRALEAGVLIAPSHRGVSILPGEYSQGDWKLISRSVLGRM